MKEDGYVVRVRAVRERTCELKLSDFDVLKSTPHDPMGTMQEGGSIPRPSALEEEALREQEAFNRSVPKRTPITKAVVLKFGATPGCRQCAAMMSGASYDRRLHSESCRQRMENLMKTDIEFSSRLETREAQRTKFFA